MPTITGEVLELGVLTLREHTERAGESITRRSGVHSSRAVYPVPAHKTMLEANAQYAVENQKLLAQCVGPSFADAVQDDLLIEDVAAS